MTSTAYAKRVERRRGAAEAARAGVERQRREGARAILALAIAALQMLFGMPFMAHGSALAPGMASPAMHPMLRWALLVSTLVVIVLARSLFVRAWAALRARTADMSTLVALGSGTAFLYSAAATISPASFATDAQLPDVHFEAASFILAFVLLGRTLEAPLAVDGMLRARAVEIGPDTRIARIAALGEDAQPARAPVQRLADRVSSYFAPGIVAIGALSALAWWVLGPEPKLVHALTTFVTVVVVSCPCALGLATPTAIATAIGRAAQLGILMRSGDALERAAQVDTVAIDKTGTLTEGEPAVVGFVAITDADANAGANASANADADAVLRLAAAVESGSEHPVGQAIVREAEARGIVVPAITKLLATAGAGARAEVEGHDVRVGALSWLEEGGVAMPAGGVPDAAFGVAIDGVLRGHAKVADALRRDAAAAVARLQAMGVRVVVLTGDREDVARAVGAALHVDDVRSELAPEDKLVALEELAKNGARVATCGDGVDDAPALARAHVGIAIGSGTDDAADASDIKLLMGDVARLPDALELARRTLCVVRQNLAWAFAYNLALVPIAAGVLVPWFGYRLPPALASAAMALSSISVVLSSLRLRRFEPGPHA